VFDPSFATMSQSNAVNAANTLLLPLVQGTSYFNPDAQRTVVSAAAASASSLPALKIVPGSYSSSLLASRALSLSLGSGYKKAVNAGEWLTLQGTVLSSRSSGSAPLLSSAQRADLGSCSQGWSLSVNEAPAALVDLSSPFLVPSFAAGGDAKLTFTLSVSCPAVQSGSSGATSMVVSSTALDVFVNSPPSLGLLSVTPEAGVELQTVFALAAKWFADADLPLSYSFGFTSRSFASLLSGGASNATSSYGLGLVSQSNLLEATLASPDRLKPASISVFVQVADSLGASTTASSLVLVAPLPRAQAAAAAMSVLVNSSTMMTTADLKQAVSVAAVVLNTVSTDCSFINATAESFPSTQCGAKLNRQACELGHTSFTCGPCLSGFPLGQDGDANSACAPLSLAVKPKQGTATPACNATSGCSALYACEDGRCKRQVKACPLGCSGRGACVFGLTARAFKH
jgi:hypothetical protein